MKYKLLDKITDPAQLEYLSSLQLVQLCDEVRKFLIDTVSSTGGHLASNLGIVELTVVLHKVFNSPVDQMVWDVGHQSYVHKLLTGRRKEFKTLRQEGGISGFPKSAESLHDAFVAGHSSTSIAVADGIATANRLNGENGHAIAIIGDGAFTGGMAYEGLNNAARGENHNLIIILNDNKMSISKNGSSVSRYLAQLRTNKSYYKLKDYTKSALRSIPIVGQSMLDVVSSSKSQLKNMVYSTSFFEELGFVHLGPVNGHDIQMLTDALTRAKQLRRPVFIHVETTKGKGYRYAEQNPGHYHGVPSFNPKVGNGTPQPGNNFSEAMGKYLAALAKKDDRICAVTAAMKYGTGLNYFCKEFRSSGRFVDVGIAEQYAVTYSAGLASKGKLPFFAVYSSFLQRSYDQLVHDCSIEPRHVVLGVDRAGLVGEDGETHHGIFDCAMLSTIPGAVIYSPCTYKELRHCLKRALYEETTLTAVRYPRGEQPLLETAFEAGNSNTTHISGEDFLLVSYGREWAQIVTAAQLLKAQGINVGLLKLNRVYPIPQEAIETAKMYKHIMFAEEGIRFGGIGQQFISCLYEQGYKGSTALRAVEGFVPQATVQRQIIKLGLDGESIADWVMKTAGRENTIEEAP